MAENIFDSHAHYNDDAFDPDRNALLAGLPAQGVRALVDVSGDPESCRASLALSQAWDYIYTAVGYHPDAAARITEADYALLAELTNRPKVVAVGEMGLDYHYDDASPREVQRAVFERQLQIAADCGKPVIIHDREAHQDTLDLLRRYRPKGVLHCFSGSAELALEVTRLGLYIGFTGVVTFKNARRAVEAARAVPPDRLLIETDCPYMAPEPYRGKRCDSSLLAFTGARLAEVRGIPERELFDLTCANACALFGLSI